MQHVETMLDRAAAWAVTRVRPNALSDGGTSALAAAKVGARRALTALLIGAVRKFRLGSHGRSPMISRHVTIRFPRSLHLGDSCFIGGHSLIDAYSTGGIVLGDRVTLREHAWVQLTSTPTRPGESIRIGSDTYIGPFAVLGASAPLVIGERCQIGARFSVSTENHVTDGDELYGSGVEWGGVTIGPDCWFGNNVTVLAGVTIGAGVVLGAGAVVTQDIPDRAVAVGVPARVVRTRAS